MPAPAARRFRPSAEWFWLLLGAALLLAIFYGRLLVGDGLYAGLSGDTDAVVTRTLYPADRYNFDRLRDGSLPWWNPHIGAGVPHLADPQTAVFQLPKLPFYFLPIGFAQFWNLTILLRLILSGAALLLFMRARRLSWGSAIFAGALWLTSAFTASHVALPGFAAFLWLPVMLWSLERFFETTRLSSLLPLALSTGFVWLSGDLSMAFLVIGVTGCYAIAKLAQRHSEDGQAPIVPLARRTVLALMLGTALAAFQLFPTLSYKIQEGLLAADLRPPGPLGDTAGALGQLQRLYFFLMPADVYRRLAGTEGAFAYRDNAFYIGITTLVLILLAGVFAWQRKRFWFWTGLTAAAIAVYLGLPGFNLVGLLPGINPADLIYLFVFGLIFVAAWGVNYFILHFQNYQKPVVGLLIGAVLLEMYLSHGRDIRFATEAELQAPHYENELLNPDASPAPRYVGTPEVIPPNLSTALQLNDLRAESHMLPRRYRSLLETFFWPDRGRGYRLDDRLLDLAGVRYLIAPNLEAFIRAGGKYIESTDPVTRHTVVQKAPWVVENTDAYPPAYLATAARVFGTHQAVINYLTANQALPKNEVVVEAGAGMPELSIFENDAPAAAAVTPARITRYTPEQVDINVQAAGPAILVLGDSFDSRWQVTVDNQRQRMLPVNGAFRGVYVDSGSHSVRFTYRLTSFYIGLGFSGTALLVLLLWAVRDWMRHRRELKSLEESFHTA
jgi:hypothetical protein